MLEKQVEFKAVQVHKCDSQRGNNAILKRTQRRD